MTTRLSAVLSTSVTIPLTATDSSGRAHRLRNAVVHHHQRRPGGPFVSGSNLPAVVTTRWRRISPETRDAETVWIHPVLSSRELCTEPYIGAKPMSINYPQTMAYAPGPAFAATPVVRVADTVMSVSPRRAEVLPGSVAWRGAFRVARRAGKVSAPAGSWSFRERGTSSGGVTRTTSRAMPSGTAPRWTDPALAPGAIPIRAAHLMELRAAVLALE